MIPLLEELEPRDCLSINLTSVNLTSINLTYGGGSIIPHIEVADLHADPSIISYTDSAMEVILTQYLALLTPYYGVGTGSLDASISVSPLTSNPTDLQIQQAIIAEIEAGNVPQPNGQSSTQVYCYFLSPGQFVSTPGYGSSVAGYHSTFNYNGWKVPYEVIYDVPPLQISQVEAHEIAETVTDPQALTGWADQTLRGNGETADIFMWNSNYQFTLAGFLFSACSTPNGQPILPPSQPPPILSTPISLFTELEELHTIAVDQFTALMYRAFALIDPKDFLGLANAEQQKLTTDPLYTTVEGQYASLLGEIAFVQALDS